MKQFIGLLCCITLLTNFKLPDLPKEFLQLLERASMKFDEPTGYKRINPIENNQMNYEIAYKHPTKRFEVRYAIRPMDNLLKEHQIREKSKNKGDINIHPNKWYKSVFEATILNISGGQLPEYSIFDKEAVKREFNADWGATVGVTLEKEFGQGYKYCLVVFIHKDNLGDAFVFYLYDNKDLISEEMMPVFHNLKFK
jgi:hypothetical protein